MHPGDLPDVYRGDQVVVLGRYHGSGDAALTLEGTVAGRPWRAAFDARFPAAAHDHVFIPRLWATRRVGFLLDQIRLHGESAELKEEIVELARTHGIVTPYTAYLIVEDEAQRGVPVTSRSLPTVDRDAGVREEAGRMFNEVKRQSSGDAAVGGAQAVDALKSAENLAAPAAASAHVRRGQGGAGGIDEALDAAEQRYAGGRAFYRNGEHWVDGTIAGRSIARRVSLKLGSAEYFDLLRRHPEVAPWLALGRRVELRVGDVVYAVGE
jgi:Ca-activated chloride channel family protein